MNVVDVTFFVWTFLPFSSQNIGQTVLWCIRQVVVASAQLLALQQDVHHEIATPEEKFQSKQNVKSLKEG